MDVDRVEVAGHRAVAAAEVAGQRPRPLAASPSEEGTSGARASSLAPREPRRRFVETSSHTSSSPTRASVWSENWVPRGWGSSGEANPSESRSLLPSGRCWTMRL